MNAPMQWKYTLSEPMLGAAEIEAVTDCIRSGWLSMGPRTAEFEERFAALIGARHAIAVSNGTAALHLALAAIGVGSEPGDEVVQPSINFVAAANMTKALGARPVFADIVSTGDPTVSPADIECKLTAHTKAVVVMHYGGYPARLDEIVELCASRAIPIIEDACHAPAQRLLGPEGRFLGTIGRIGCFSFFSNKNMTTGEGGMVTTDDDELAVRLRLLRGQGMDPERRYVHIVRGYNYRLTNVAAAIGVGQMERAEQLVEDRRRIARWYDRRLADVGSLTLPVETPEVRNSYWMYSLLLESADDRDGVMEHLKSCGVETRPFFYPVHEMPMYRSARTDRVCPVTRDVSYRGISLPSSSYLREEDIDEIASALRAAVEANSPIVKAA